MGDERYTIIKRIGSVLVAIALWFLSIQFSVAGFSFQVDGMVWAGWVLGFAVTVIELIFTSENRGRNITITFLGITAYAYGIWSNVVGISASRGVDGFSAGLVFSIVLGLILEIAPEPLFLWGILGGETGEGDIVSTLANIWSDARKRPVGRPKISKFSLTPNIQPKPKVVDMVSKPNYHMATRLSITTVLNSGGRLIWDKNKTQSPVLMSEIDGMPLPVSRSLVRKMVDERVLIERQRGTMVSEFVLSGSEPPIKPLFL